MIFNSFVFWGFLALVVAVYWRLPHRSQNIFLFAASYFFYGYWDWRYLGLIAASTLVDFLVSTNLERLQDARRRKQLIVVSVIANLAFLGFFKYFNFFISEFAQLLQSVGLQPHIATLSIVLPVGISFYTFQSMSYTIDVYRRTTKPTKDLIEFALFVSYFPQLVAGPIERSSQLLPQITAQRRYRTGDFSEGLYHVLIGMFKKVILADNVAPIVNRVFDASASGLTSTEVLLGIVAFALQIYGDFSGYSSIAQGVSRWLGIDLSYNFRTPYFSRTPSEFWLRWHISLSSWLKDYLYIPLGGNRRTPNRTYVNLMLTMLLGGLWHGASWTFVAWGAWHGLILVAYRAAGVESSSKLPSGFLMEAASMLLMFFLVCVGWTFFRAENLPEALAMLGALGNGGGSTPFAAYAAAMLAFLAGPLLVYEWRAYRCNDMAFILQRPAWQQFLVYGYALGMLIVFPAVAPQVFIYFQF